MGILNLAKLDTCDLAGPQFDGGTSNMFSCPLPEGMPLACAAVQCVGVDAMEPMTIVIVIVVLLLFTMCCVYCLVRLRQHQIRRKTKLLQEVTSTSATVMNDLTDRKQAGGPVVIVDGKSMNNGSEAASGDAA